jgi:hypothetical protein
LLGPNFDQSGSQQISYAAIWSEVTLLALRRSEAKRFGSFWLTTGALFLADIVINPRQKFLE